MDKTLVLLPSVVRSQGMGHMERCRSLSQSLGTSAALFLPRDWLLSPEGGGFRDSQIFSSQDLETFFAGAFLVFKWEDLPNHGQILVDFQATPPPLYKKLQSQRLPFIGWDEGGAFRKNFPFLVDTLSNLSTVVPNQARPELINLGVRGAWRPFQPQKKPKVLVVFGGADPSGLTVQVCQFLQARTSWGLHVLLGPLYQGDRNIPGAKLMAPVKDLKPALAQFDLVVTSFGLTMMEALQAGTPVLICNPSSYHEALTQRSKLPSLGALRPRAFRWKKALQGLLGSTEGIRAFLPANFSPPATFWQACLPSGKSCPSCGGEGRVVHRESRRTYFSCNDCSLEFMHTLDVPPETYSEDYFFNDYRNQYGKTYLEDFPHIENLGRQRLKVLQKISPDLKGKWILDLGCAYGPFLAAAQSVGLKPAGVDISAGAVAYVKESLQIPAVAKPLEELHWQKDFDAGVPPHIVTLWYVIEHFADLEPLKRFLKETLPIGGLLAFGTPNAWGLTRSLLPHKFWEISPWDHFTLWSPRTVKKVLNSWGFQVIKIRMTGEHPERFPGLKPKSAWLPLIRVLSRWLRWGETFEVYAKRIK